MFRSRGRSLFVDFYKNRVLEKYSNKEQKAITLKQLTVFGRSSTMNLEKLLRSANYIREELPVRLAHRIREFQQLPFVVGANPAIEQVYQLYWEAFEKFRAVPQVNSLEENQVFCSVVSEMLSQHKKVIPLLVVGIHESQKYMEEGDLNKFMNETLQSRISRRVLAEQHIALSNVFDGTVPAELPNIIGIVNNRCNAHSIVMKCAGLVSDLFTNAYEIPAPDVVVDGNLHASFTYIPDHIEYIIFELLKNSMRHTFLSHGEKKALLPPIRVTIGVGDDQIMFRVSDQGGGIEKSVLSSIWNFVKLESKDISQHPEIVAKVRELIPINISMGIGLPMSQVYANYWGGSISVYSMDRYGTDSYVTLTTGNSQERLEYTKIY